MDDQSKGPIPPALSPEQRARDMLERMGVRRAQSMTAGDVVELANLIAHHDELQASDPTWDYTPGAEKYPALSSGEGTPAAFPPFGFTREDVDRLRQIAVDAEARHDASMEYEDFRAQEWAESLADRIASLLPPSDEKPPHG